MEHQLKMWQGALGDAYTDRNVIDWRARLPSFGRMLAGCSIRRVLEVGCNRGHNLLALRELLGHDAEIVGVEPNQYARQLSTNHDSKAEVLPGHIFHLPFEDESFDLVLTCGVLIHIPLEHLEAALSEVYRCSIHFILAIEYFAQQETPIPYCGRNDLLWKRDFLRHYQTQFPELVLIRQGYWTPEDGFDRTHWWLLQKSIGPNRQHERRGDRPGPNG